MKEISNRPNKNRRKRINQTNPMNIEKCLFSTIKCCTPMSSNLYTFSNRFWTFHSFLDECCFFVMRLSGGRFSLIFIHLLAG